MTEGGVDVDATALESYLSEALDESVVGTEVLHDGLNLSVGVSTRNEERAYVLRRPNKLRHTDLFNDPDREYALLERLRENAPPDPETTLLHGDFKPGNVLFAGGERSAVTGERPAVTGVLDWEAAALGDPRTELGYLLLYWRDEGDPTPSLDGIEARYSDEDAIRELREVAEDGFYPFTTYPGSPTRRELVARYEDRTGIPVEDDRFYRAHAALLLATVWEDLHRHLVEARAVEAGAESGYEPLADYVALVATRIVDGEFPL